MWFNQWRIACIKMLLFILDVNVELEPWFCEKEMNWVEMSHGYCGSLRVASLTLPLSAVIWLCCRTPTTLISTDTFCIYASNPAFLLFHVLQRWMEDCCVFWPHSPLSEQMRASVTWLKAAPNQRSQLLKKKLSICWFDDVLILNARTGVCQKSVFFQVFLKVLKKVSTLCWFYLRDAASPGAISFNFLWRILMRKCFGFWQQTLWITITNWHFLCHDKQFCLCRLPYHGDSVSAMTKSSIYWRDRSTFCQIHSSLFV